MKRAIIGLSFAVLLSSIAYADSSGEYAKKNGAVEVKQKGNAVKFSINSSVGGQACELEGAAEMIDAQRAVFTSKDKSDKCVVAFNFANGGLKITSKSCDGYCGLNAAGSMDGTYKKKNAKKK